MYLSDYNIRTESIIHLIERRRGGMYHFTSARRDFHTLSYDCAEAVQNVLGFKIKNMNQFSLLSSADLQNFVLQAQGVLSNLYNTVKEALASDDLPNLKDIVTSHLHPQSQFKSDTHSPQLTNISRWEKVC